MLRILLLTTDLQRGGYPLRLARMARRLAAVGVEPIVGCLARRGPVHAMLDADGIETFACDASGAGDVGVIGRLATVIRRTNPVIVHAGLFHANIAARLVGRWDRPRPIITTTVTIEIERLWHRWGESLTAGASDLHVVNSRAVASHVIEDFGIPPTKVVLLPNAVDFAAVAVVPAADRASLGIPAEAPLVVWAGRFDPVKDLSIFIDVICMLRDDGARAILLGDGPSRRGMMESVRERGLSDRILLPGWRDDAISWIKAADVMLFPSRTEGSPNTVIEAVACGCRVVASDIPACRELLEGGAGQLCPTGDAAAMAAAVRNECRARAGRREMGRSVDAEFMSRHDINRVVHAWRDIYDAVLGDAFPEVRT